MQWMCRYESFINNYEDIHEYTIGHEEHNATNANITTFGVLEL